MYKLNSSKKKKCILISSSPYTTVHFAANKIKKTNPKTKLMKGGAFTNRKSDYKNVDIVNIETSSYCNRKCGYCPVSVYGRNFFSCLPRNSYQLCHSSLYTLGGLKGSLKSPKFESLTHCI